MKKYFVEHQIKTVTDNRVSIAESSYIFSVDTIEFEQEFTAPGGLTDDYWVASGEIEAETWQNAIFIFRNKLGRIASRVSLIGQGYIDFIWRPFLIHSPRVSNVIFFRNVFDSGHVGLYFFEKHKLALEGLLLDQKIPDEFYLYWNDATNTTGYSAKLLLMFAAISVLVENRDKAIYPKQEDIKNRILGPQLCSEIYSNKKGRSSRDGLRNRLSHGEYFKGTTGQRDYVAEMHQKVIAFINAEILKKELIEENITLPQRNFNENKIEWGTGFVKKTSNSSYPKLCLKDVMKYYNQENNDFYSRIGHGEEFEKVNKEF